MGYDLTKAGERIKSERKKAGYTQEQLSELINLSPTYLGQIENGRRGVNLSNVCKVANVLGVSLDYLCGNFIDEKIINKQNELDENWANILLNLSPSQKELLTSIVADMATKIFNER